MAPHLLPQYRLLLPPVAQPMISVAAYTYRDVVQAAVLLAQAAPTAITLATTIAQPLQGIAIAIHPAI